MVLELWDLIVSVFGNISHISDRTGKPVNGEDKHQKSHNKIDAMEDIDINHEQLCVSWKHVSLWDFFLL